MNFCPCLLPNSLPPFGPGQTRLTMVSEGPMWTTISERRPLSTFRPYMPMLSPSHCATALLPFPQLDKNKEGCLVKEKAKCSAWVDIVPLQMWYVPKFFPHFLQDGAVPVPYTWIPFLSPLLWPCLLSPVSEAGGRGSGGVPRLFPC